MRGLRSSRIAAAALGAAILAACSARPEYSDLTYVPLDPPPPKPVAPPAGPAPDYGPTKHLAEAPPPISGGTLSVTRYGVAIAADPDRDRIFVVNVADQRVRTIEVPRHSEPGRSIEDFDGIVHVVLRNSGEIWSIDPKTAIVVGRRPVCNAPRGIALTSNVDGGQLLVACAGGEVKRLPAALDGTATLVGRVGDDLRDIVVSGGRVYVSTFRSADIMEVNTNGNVVSHLSLAAAQTSKPVIPGVTLDRTPRIAWRMIPSADGGAPMVVHQLASNEPVPTSSEPGMKKPDGKPRTSSGYGSSIPGSGCGATADPVVVMALTKTSEGSLPLRVTNGFAALPVDVASDGEKITVVAAGNGHTAQRPQLFTYPVKLVQMPNVAQRDPRFAKDMAMRDCALEVGGSSAEVGQLVAAAYLSKARLILQSREPAQLVLWPERTIIPLSSDSREDTGHAIFHSNSSVGLACASCHAEGSDDGHTWTFDDFGMRRTPSLLGTLEGTAPYHWSGDMDGLSMLADKVFTNRMRGPSLDDPQKEVLQQWLFALPPAPARPTKDAATIARGKALFESTNVGCATCHNGPRLTTSASVDVGTGGIFQVPSLLGVGSHAPYLHDGCAQTLRERFDRRCTTDMHGKTSALSSSEIDDLVGYLESL